MPTVKTAISVRESLFKRAEELAKELHISRSQLFAMAMEEFLSRHEAQDVLKRLNDVYGSAPGDEEQREEQPLVEAAKASLARLTEDDEW